ncbi:MAG: hypothetical protein ACX93N_03530 [Pseudohaliea sp.]
MTMSITQTDSTPLLDGRCRASQWQGAVGISLPADVSLLLMHDADSIFVCAKGKPEDFTTLDVYLRDASTDLLYNLHVSAQLGERVMDDGNWSEMTFCNHRAWTAFWVPFSGTEETDCCIRPRFLEGSHREVRVVRGRFPGEALNMMFSVSAVHHGENDRAELRYPRNALDTDPATRATFTLH